MKLDRLFVEDVIYGWNASRRFLQDDPVRPDVWIAFAEKPDEAQSLLLEPLFQVRPGTVANGLRKALHAKGAEKAELTYNQSSVAARLTFAQVVKYVLPRTAWWADAIAASDGKAPAGEKAVPDTAHLREDLEALNEGRRLKYYSPEVLTLVRVVGLLAYARSADGTDSSLSDAYKARREGNAGADADFLNALSKAIATGWERVFRNRLPPKLEKADRQVYSINLDRPAAMAVHRSALTIKADAARLLFEIRCSDITWAVIDSGIDALHQAFRGNSAAEEARIAAIPDADERKTAMLDASRVVETYDFTRIRDLLSAAARPGKVDAIVAEFGLDGTAATLLRTRKEHLSELQRRMRQGRDIDWEVLRPILCVPHDESYQPPRNPHGTHVAGILGANWKKPAGGGAETAVRGICPDIRLIDLRVCRADGSSDEFTIMSALQFLRHLNSHRDYMVVHGANISLSLKHDVANFACGRTPVCDEAERLVAAGVVVVAAAGNNGYNRFRTVREDANYEGYCAISITDPGNADSVITVGSTHRYEPHSYGVSYFSSRGPTGDGRVKPDLVAPGEKIDAPVPDDGYARMDGTSMAAPHVSGAAALLMARNNELIGEPRRIKQILCTTATDLGRERYFQGHGLVDVLRALQSV
ncbi:S8 family serine peptidase [Azospirillum soli]|uniref:S8 family serine peptidase n=1 Tax=Azospirillum soli TaxID=1304799 RepID=UPI001AEB0DE4|nr:S8 family serine peptidase [Azospirillum soli]MBP2315332.1 subtilisin family serine protease [Azospirillum soli]